MDILRGSVKVMGRTLGLEMALALPLCDLGQVTVIHLILNFLSCRVEIMLLLSGCYELINSLVNL